MKIRHQMKFRIVATLGLGLVAVGLWSRLQADDDNREGSKGIVGSWDISITGTPFRILRTYDLSGGVIDAYAFPPFTPTTGPLINSGGHGTWVRTGRNQIKVIVKYFQLDPQKNATFQILDSVGSVEEVVTLDRPDEYGSAFTTNITRPNGTPVLTNSGRTVGKRIKIEALHSTR